MCEAGVPSLQAMDWYRSVACEEPGHRAGGERGASEGSSICCSPLLPIARTTAWTKPPTPSMEKLSSTNPGPGARKVGERWCKAHT